MRIADRAPVICSCCFQQKPQAMHIDLEVAWDGPVVNNDGSKYSVDDIILCEWCCSQIVELLPQQGMRQRLRELEARALELEDVTHQALAYARRVEALVGSRPAALDTPSPDPAPAPPRRRVKVA